MIPRELLQKVRQIEIRTRRLVSNSLAGQYLSVFKGQGLHFDEVREYQPGDEVRFIDWNVTARMHQPFVKQFVEERELTVMLVMDLSASGRFGSASQSKRELAAEIAAVLALAAVRNHDNVGLVLYTDRVEHFVPPQRGQRHIMRLVRDILHAEPQHPGTRLRTALEFIERVTLRRSVMFLLSDFLDDLPLRALRRAHRRHDVIAVQVLDRHEEELPDLGRVVLEDAETGEVLELNTGDARRRRAFSTHRATAQAALEKQFSSLGIDALTVRPGEPYTRELHRFLQARYQRQQRR